MTQASLKIPAEIAHDLADYRADRLLAFVNGPKSPPVRFTVQ